MKKFTRVLFIAILSTMIISCDKDEEEIVTPPVQVEENDLLGSWEMTGFSVADGKTSAEVQGQSIVASTFTQQGTSYDYVLTFSDDPKTLTGIGSYDVEIVSSAFGQTQTQNLTVDSVPGFDTASWSVIDGKILRTVSEQNGQVAEGLMEIVESTANTLKLKVDMAQASQAGVDTANGLGGIADLGIEISGTLYMTFSR